MIAEVKQDDKSQLETMASWANTYVEKYAFQSHAFLTHLKDQNYAAAEAYSSEIQRTKQTLSLLHLELAFGLPGRDVSINHLIQALDYNPDVKLTEKYTILNPMSFVEENDETDIGTFLIQEMLFTKTSEQVTKANGIIDYIRQITKKSNSTDIMYPIKIQVD